MIIYYGSYSTTDGKEYLIGYEEGDSSTGDVIVKEIGREKENEDDFLYRPDIVKKIKIGEREIKEGKKVLWDYKNIIKEKIKKPINLKNLYYKQFEDEV